MSVRAQNTNLAGLSGTLMTARTWRISRNRIAARVHFPDTQIAQRVTS